MPEISNVNPPGLPKPVGYSHATVAGELVFLGGQIGCDESGRVTHPGDMASQCGQAFRNLKIALEAAGCRPTNVVKLTYFVTDVAAYKAAAREVGAAYRTVFGKHYPASTLVEVKGLYEPDALFEVECIALRG
jgi:enamine deaminase RidA (YjgF/YER057c/UK114 family)